MTQRDTATFREHLTKVARPERGHHCPNLGTAPRRKTRPSIASAQADLAGDGADPFHDVLHPHLPRDALYPLEDTASSVAMTRSFDPSVNFSLSLISLGMTT